MCLIIDTNTFGPVFDVTNSKHSKFRPVLLWLCKGRGTIVIGGSGYFRELRKATKYLGVLAEFKRAGKVFHADDAAVDADEVTVRSMLSNKDFDDQHLVALLRVTGCLIICSDDQRAYPFFHSKVFFSRRAHRPRIFRDAVNRDLLCDKNIADCCKPCATLTKAKRAALEGSGIQ